PPQGRQHRADAVAGDARRARIRVVAQPASSPGTGSTRMNRNTLIGLALAAAVALVAAIALQVSHQPRSAAEGGQPTVEALAPALVDHVNDVDKVVVTAAGNTVRATLVRGDKGWTLLEKGGYAVDTGKLRAFLLK